DAGDERALEEDERDHAGEKPRLAREHGGLEEHPDAREEDGDERVAEWEELGEHLVRVEAPGEREPGEERADRQREPELRRADGGAERDDERRERKELRRPGARDE